MSAQPQAPFFVTPYADRSGGVDYLGLRAVNLALMDDLLPSINNVTVAIRPYSLLCWTSWAFREEKLSEGEAEAKRDDFKRFREKLEVLFGWSHQLHDAGGGLVGNAQNAPTTDAPVPLTFEHWNRNVSWLDAVNYGPSLKTDNGLGFLVQVRPGVFAITNSGEALASAFDTALRVNTGYSEMRSIKVSAVRAELARSLYESWMVSSPTEGEAAAFRAAFYQPDQAAATNSVGRRSACLSLIRYTLERSGPLTVDQLRRVVTLTNLPRDLESYPREPLARAQGLWRVLQLRQAQRMAFEALFGWVETQVLGEGQNLSSQIAERLAEIIAAEETRSSLPESWIQEQLDRLADARDQAESYLQAAQHVVDLDFVRQILELSEALDESRDRSAYLSLKLLLLCAQVAGELEQDEHCRAHVGRGGPARIRSRTGERSCLPRLRYR